MEKKKGFTLVELLVVIAIIALLMSIMMPALARVKRQAKTVLCLSNLKQWGLIYQMYSQDNNGQFHRRIQNASTTYGNKYAETWYRMFLPYYQDDKLRLCPEATKSTGEGGQQPFVVWGQGEVTNPDDPLYGRTSYSSYGENLFCTNPPNSAHNDHNPISMNFKSPNVRGASNIPLFGDCSYVGGWPKDADEPQRFDGDVFERYEDMKKFCLNRHTQTANLLFVDLAVRNTPMKQFYTFKWNQVFDTTVQPVWPAWMNGFKE